MTSLLWLAGAWLALGAGLLTLWCAVASHRPPPEWDWDDNGSQW